MADAHMPSAMCIGAVVNTAPHPCRTMRTACLRQVVDRIEFIAPICGEVTKSKTLLIYLAGKIIAALP
jgi:hypothetical protein